MSITSLNIRLYVSTKIFGEMFLTDLLIQSLKRDTHCTKCSTKYFLFFNFQVR